MARAVWDVTRICATQIQMVANVALGHPETNGHLSGALIQILKNLRTAAGTAALGREASFADSE